METKQRPVTGLHEAFASIPDPRSAKGTRHPLPVILAIATAAMLCGARSVYAIAQWGRDQPPDVLRALGLRRPRSPCVATFHRVFVQLDPAAFEQALGRWAERNLPGGERAIAVDGKRLRGIHGELLPGVHLVAAYTHAAGLVLGQSGGPGRYQGGRTDGRPAAAGADRRAGSGRDLRRAAHPAHDGRAGARAGRRLLHGGQGVNADGKVGHAPG